MQKMETKNITKKLGPSLKEIQGLESLENYFSNVNEIGKKDMNLLNSYLHSFNLNNLFEKVTQYSPPEKISQFIELYKELMKIKYQ